MTDRVFKCRKCRHQLFTESAVVNTHGKPLFVESSTEGSSSCESAQLLTEETTTTLWYLSFEESAVPNWITHAVERGNWIKGKLLCPRCGGRLGSFDFITSQCCPCRQYNVPALHVNKNRVDHVSKATTKSALKYAIFANSPDTGMHLVKCDENFNRHDTGQASCNSVSNHEASKISVDRAFSPDARELESCEMFEGVSDDCLSARIVVSPALSVSATHTSAVSCTDCKNPDITISGDCRDRDLQFEEMYISRRRRHKRVVSDCSDLAGLKYVGSNRPGGLGDLVYVAGKNYQRSDSVESLSSTASSRTNSTEDVRQRNHGNSRCMSLSTSLLKKRLYSHRRAQSMTVTSNRFEFLHHLQEDNNSLVQVGRSGHHEDKKRADRQPLSEIADPTIPDDFLCPVCLDLMYSPHSCLPCKHSFCESCLRQLTRTQPVKTKCPMCRQLIIRCQTQYELTYLLKTRFPASYARRRKAARKHLSKANPLPHTRTDFRHKLDLIMQHRLCGRRFREICRDHFIMTVFVYTVAAILLLGLFLFLILVCSKSLFFIFKALQWVAMTTLGFVIGAGRLAVSLRPCLFPTMTEAAAANRVILSVIVVGVLYRLWTHFRSRDRTTNHNMAGRN